jgi:hypothetical protein
MRLGKAVAIGLGLLLALSGVVGVVVLGNVLNPPRMRIVVAAQTIPQGTRLSQEMLGYLEVEMASDVTDLLMTEANVGQFLGGQAVRTIYANEPVLISAISVSDTPLGQDRLSLLLVNADLALVSVPVDPTTAPPAVREGDLVDIVYVTDGVGFGNPFEQNPQDSGIDVFVPQPGDPGQTQPGFGQLTPTVAAGQLPLAKVIVREAVVFSVVREAQQVQRTNAEGRTVTVQVPGDAIALEVAIPREAQEILQFAVGTGSVRLTLLSARVVPGDPLARQPSLGMAYHDLVAFFEMDRLQALATDLPAQPLGPGAAVVQMWTPQPPAEAEGASSEVQAPGSNAGVPTNSPTVAAPSDGDAPPVVTATPQP